MNALNGVTSPQLLTARPWAERGSRFTRGLLFFFVFFLSVTRRRPPLGQTLSHATCDVFPPEAVKT